MRLQKSGFVASPNVVYLPKASGLLYFVLLSACCRRAMASCDCGLLPRRLVCVPVCATTLMAHRSLWPFTPLLAWQAVVYAVLIVPFLPFSSLLNYLLILPLITDWPIR